MKRHASWHPGHSHYVHHTHITGLFLPLQILIKMPSFLARSVALFSIFASATSRTVSLSSNEWCLSLSDACMLYSCDLVSHWPISCGAQDTIVLHPLTYLLLSFFTTIPFHPTSYITNYRSWLAIQCLPVRSSCKSTLKSGQVSEHRINPWTDNYKKKRGRSVSWPPFFFTSDHTH